MSNIYTIGHSNHGIEHFIDLLKKNRIEVLVDVRSTPYSRYLQQYNQEQLKSILARNAIKYVFLGKELGARRNESSCYINGQVKYELVKDLPLFKAGVERLRLGYKDYRIALMCAEKDPIDCHRMILVTRNLNDFDCEIVHIKPNGDTETDQHAVQRLRSLYKLDTPELLRNETDLIDEAYKKQSEKVAYTEEHENYE